MQNDNIKNSKFWLWIFFLLYPLGAFIYSVKYFQIKSYRVFILFFFIFYGFTFLPIPNSDGSRYKSIFEDTQVYNFQNYAQDVEGVFIGNSNNTDFYHLTLLYVAKLISSDPRVYFLLAASIYFFVFLKLLAAVWGFVTRENSAYFISFFIGCCFIYNLSVGVNSIRFPLAFMVFCLGSLKLLLTAERKYIFLVFLSVLIHFAFLYSVLFLTAIYFLKFSIRPWVLYVSLLAVIAISFIFSSFIQSNLGSLASTAQSKFTGYTGEGFLERRDNTKEYWNWYVTLNLYSTYIFSVFSLLFTRFKYFKVKFNLISNRLWVFSFVLFIHAILSGSVIDTVSNRYNLVFVFFELVYLLYLSAINRNNKLLNFLNYVYIPIIIINILIKLRGDLYTANVIVFFGNFVSSIFIDETISIQDYLFN